MLISLWDKFHKDLMAGFRRSSTSEQAYDCKRQVNRA